MRSHRLFLCLLGLLLCCCALRAFAADLVVSREYFLDASGTMSFEQVQDAQFTPIGNIVNLGFTRSVLWLRLTLPPSPGGRPMHLRVLPATLDRVTFFTPRQSDEAGTRGVELSGLDLWHVELPPAASGRAHYLRVRSTVSMMLSAVIEPMPEFRVISARQSMIVGIVLGCLGATTVGALLLFALHRDLALLAGLLTVTSSAVVYAAMYGQVQHMVVPASWRGDGILAQVAIMANAFFSLLFLDRLLARTSLRTWARRLNAFFPALALALPMGLALFDRQWALQALGYVAVAGAICAFSLALASQFWQPRHTSVAILVMLLSALMFRIAAVRLGIGGDFDFTLELFTWRAAAPPLAFCVIFAVLEGDRRAALRASQAQEQQSRREMLAAREQRDTRERLVTTLMHEIKTPLSTIQLAAASLGRGKAPEDVDGKRLCSINDSVDDLNGIVERYVQVDQFEQGMVDVAKSPFPLDDLFKDVLRSLDSARVVVRAPAEAVVVSDFHCARVVLINLLGNALKYSPPGSAIMLEVDPWMRDGLPGLKISVSNAVGAAGIPDQDLLYSRYYRSEGARSVAGAGLGLWLAQETAKSADTEIGHDFANQKITFTLWMESA
ncbi:MAG: 7TM-DISM domain-containing protein [Betaproteobacteria bacterium]